MHCVKPPAFSFPAPIMDRMVVICSLLYTVRSSTICKLGRRPFLFLLGDTCGASPSFLLLFLDAEPGVECVADDAGVVVALGLRSILSIQYFVPCTFDPTKKNIQCPVVRLYKNSVVI
eukprot:330095_1